MPTLTALLSVLLLSLGRLLAVLRRSTRRGAVPASDQENVRTQHAQTNNMKKRRKRTRAAGAAL